MYDRVFNFSAGPAVLPEPVLERVRDEMLNHQESGMAVMEMSHRSKAFTAIIEATEASLRAILGVPDDYAVLFLQGGASLQFGMVPLNFYRQGHPVDVLQTGSWTQKATTELSVLADYREAASTKADNFTRLPNDAEITVNSDASYVYLCSNNTIFGTRWANFPETGSVPLVADMSSDLLSRPIDVSRFGLIFAGAQKNIGPAGVTVVLVRKDWAAEANPNLPTMLDYRTHIDKGSLFNTPPTFSIYVVGLVLAWLQDLGGLKAMEVRNEAKAQLLYDAIDNTDFYAGPVNEADRSRMNVVFRIAGGNENLERTFVSEATAQGLTNLKGHRSVGGLRASIYNAQPLEGVQALVDFMADFEARHG